MIRLENVYKRFGSLEVLKGYSLHVRKGETFVVLGRSGIGKSVTLKHIVGSLSPDKGEVWVDGNEISRTDRKTLFAVRKKVAYLFQSGALINWMTVRENVELPLREHSKLSDEKIRARAEEKLSLMEMLDAMDKYPSEISGGMKKRAALARVLAQEPKIILYDEPTAGLDPVMTNNVTRLIRTVQQKTGITSIVVTHHLECAFFVGDKVGIHHDGRIIFTGTPREIQETSHPVVTAFLKGEAVDKDVADTGEADHDKN